MKVLFPKREPKCIETYEGINEGSNLYKLLLDTGPIITEALLNFYAKRGDKSLYKNVINKKNLPYFSSYVNHFNSLEKKLIVTVSDSYRELQEMKGYELEAVYSVLDSSNDICASNVWGEKYASIIKTRNKILKDEVDLSSRLPKLDYTHSVNINYAHLFSYDFKKDMDPRKAKALLYKKTLKIGQDPKVYTDFNLFSLKDKASIAIAFYGRAIEFTDFMDMFNSINYSVNKGEGSNVKPIL
ncbi:MAG: hypothetical protein M1580_02695 [Candidatus Parvarchaeota archaeon]|nr:hypothetical protein [Candidatus Parvarchaeota archaeon]